MTKVCIKCGIEKDNSQYYHHKKSRYGTENACKKCRNEYSKINKKLPRNIPKVKARQKTYRENHLERIRELNKKWAKENRPHLLKYYQKYNKQRTVEQKMLSRGLMLRRYWPGSNPSEALENYEKMLVSQDYKCAICKKPEETFKKSLAVDHNHSTGEPRKLLCYRCNRLYVGIHTTETAFAVYEYLKQFDKKVG